MTEHKELVEDLRAFGKLTTNASAHHGQYLANEAARVIEEQAAEIVRLREERGVAVGALERVAVDGVSSLDKAIAQQAVEIARLRDALKGLLADIEEYQQINNLGGENNHWQVIARNALTHPPETGS